MNFTALFKALGIMALFGVIGAAGVSVIFVIGTYAPVVLVVIAALLTLSYFIGGLRSLYKIFNS